MKSVFVLEHLHTQSDGEECWKKIGIYLTHDDALIAIERIKTQPGFSDYPHLIDHSDHNCIHGFNIDEYLLNEDHWTEGFITV